MTTDNSNDYWPEDDAPSTAPDIVIDSITTTEIEPSNEFEEDLFRYMPKVKALIDTGEDVDLSTAAMADYVGVNQSRFKKLYNAAKKDMAQQTEMRFGPDLRLTMINDADIEITRLKTKIESLQQGRTEVFELIDAAKDKDNKDAVQADEIPRHLMLIATMSEKDFCRALNDLSSTLRTWQDRKAKLAGVEVQRKEIVHANATSLLKQLYDFEQEKRRSSVVESGTLLSAAFTMPLDEPPLPNLK